MGLPDRVVGPMRINYAIWHSGIIWEPGQCCVIFSHRPIIWEGGSMVVESVSREELEKKIDIVWYYDAHTRQWIIDIVRREGGSKLFRFGKKTGEKVIELLQFMLGRNNHGKNLDDNLDDLDEW